MSQHEEGTATFSAFARILGERSPSYVTELKRAGRLILAEDGKRVRVAESLALIATTRDPGKDGVAARHASERGAMDEATEPPVSENDGHASRRSRAMADKAEWDAKAAQRDYEVSMGRLMDSEQVAAAAADAVTALRTRLEALPHELAPQLAPLKDEAQVQAKLTSEIEHALLELSRQFEGLAKGGRA